MLAKLIPLLVAGGITVHSSGEVKDKLKGMLGMTEGYVTKQRMGTILRSARLHVVTEGEWEVRGDRQMRRWIRRNVRIEKDEDLDPSVDLWGTAFRSKLKRGRLTLVSAGPDKSFGTPDDLRASSNIFDY